MKKLAFKIGIEAEIPTVLGIDGDVGDNETFTYSDFTTVGDYIIVVMVMTTVRLQRCCMYSNRDMAKASNDGDEGDVADDDDYENENYDADAGADLDGCDAHFK